jgi:threonine aldolase
MPPSRRLADLARVCVGDQLTNNYGSDDGGCGRSMNQPSSAVNLVDEWDVYGDFHKSAEDSFLRKFEESVATEFGMEDAVFMPSGVIGQSIALLIHHDRKQQQQQQSIDRFNSDDGTRPLSRPAKKAFACHPTSHLLLHENEGFHHLCGFDAKVIQDKRNNNSGRGLGGEPLRYQHLIDSISTDISSSNGQEEVEWNDISTIMLELPHRELGGKLTPWDDMIKIRNSLNKRRNEHGHVVAFHCDGARIFEATTGYGDDGRTTLQELTEPFDSMYISFYKGLGGLAGGMLLGDTDFCKNARRMLRQFGGNLFTLHPYIVAAWVGYQQYWIQPNNNDKNANSNTNKHQSSILTFQEKKDKLVRIVSKLSSLGDSSFGKIGRFEPRIPQVPMVHIYLRATVEECDAVRDEIIIEDGVCIFHRLRPIDGDDHIAKSEGYQCKLELSIGQANGDIGDEIWISSWKKFSERILSSTENKTENKQVMG